MCQLMEKRMNSWKLLLCIALLSSGNSYAGVKEGRITYIQIKP